MGGGSPVRLGVGAVGPAGSREGPLPSPPDPASPPTPQTTHGAGASRRAPHSLVLPRRGRREGAPRRPWCAGRGAVCGGRARARPASPGGGCVGGQVGTPPGACGVVRARPVLRVGAGRAPFVGNLPGAPPVVSALLFFFSLCLCDLAGQRQAPSPGGGRAVPRAGNPRRKTPRNQTRTTLSGGSLGSCVDEERS